MHEEKKWTGTEGRDEVVESILNKKDEEIAALKATLEQFKGLYEVQGQIVQERVRSNEKLFEENAKLRNALEKTRAFCEDPRSDDKFEAMEMAMLVALKV